MRERYTLLTECRCSTSGFSSTRACTDACFTQDTRAVIDAASRRWLNRMATVGNWRGGAVPCEITQLGSTSPHAFSDWVDGPEKDPLYVNVTLGHRNNDVGDGRAWEQDYSFEEDQIVITQRYPGVVEEHFEVRVAKNPATWPTRTDDSR